MEGIIDAAEQTNSPLIIILATILVALASASGTLLLLGWKITSKEMNRLHSMIKSKDEQIININKEKDDLIEVRNGQLTDIAEKAFEVISSNNISSIRCRDALKTVMDKINSI